MDRSKNPAARGRSSVQVLVAMVTALVVMTALGAGVASGSVSQEPPKPTWSMPAEMQPGENGTVTGEGFQPGATVTMTGPGNVALGTAVADEFGRITMSMTVPMTMVSGPANMTLVGTNIGGQVVTLEKTVNIGTLVSAQSATPMPMTPAFTG